jgi:hypothetical protein
VQSAIGIALPFSAVILCGYLAARFRILPDGGIAGVNASLGACKVVESAVFVRRRDSSAKYLRGRAESDFAIVSGLSRLRQLHCF